MSSPLTSQQITQVSPLPGSVARVLASGAQLSEGHLQMLLVRAGLDEVPAATDEVRRSVKLLAALRSDPT